MSTLDKRVSAPLRVSAAVVFDATGSSEGTRIQDTYARGFGTRWARPR